MKAVFHTEDINSYGFWIKMSGMNLDRYKKNPILLYDHNSSEMSIGRVNNLRVENNQLVGDVEFDTEDKIGKKLARKYEKGYMLGFSIGIRITEWSEEKKHIKQGQSSSTATKSELFEISAVNLPSNEDALKLYSKDGKSIKLSGNSENYLNSIIPKIQKKSKMKQIAIALGLQEDATEKQIIDAITLLNTKDVKTQELAKKLVEKEVELTLSYGRSKGVINDKNEATYRKAAEKDVDLALELIDGAETKIEKKEEKLSDKIDGQSPKPKTPVVEKTWEQMSEDELMTLRSDEPKKYVSLFEKQYGFKPIIK